MQNTIETKSYWDGTGEFQSSYDLLWNKHVPEVGTSKTVAGELIRAVSRLVHDYYNNGCGNNTSGAFNYLVENNLVTFQEHKVIKPLTCGETYKGRYVDEDGNLSEVSQMYENIVDRVIAAILDNPELEETANNVDMFDLQEEVFWNNFEDEYEF